MSGPMPRRPREPASQGAAPGAAGGEEPSGGAPGPRPSPRPGRRSGPRAAPLPSPRSPACAAHLCGPSLIEPWRQLPLLPLRPSCLE